MAGKFLKRNAIIDLVRDADRTNAVQKRSGLRKHPVRTFVCGCPDENCGGWHAIDTETTIPTDEEVSVTLSENSQIKKRAKQYRRQLRKRIQSS